MYVIIIIYSLKPLENNHNNGPVGHNLKIFVQKQGICYLLEGYKYLFIMCSVCLFVSCSAMTMSSILLCI